jgi:uncharacterized protein DUF3455
MAYSRLCAEPTGPRICCDRHCEEQSDAGIQFALTRLSGLLCSARNDGVITYTWLLKRAALLPLLLAASVVNAPAQTPLPTAIATPGEAVVLSVHAEGAQVYECKAGADGKLAYAFREPIATLLLDGKTVGRHYAGPTWEHSDGSVIVAKPVGNAPGATANDISWLKLEVISSRGSGNGVLSGVTTVQRINTQGGKLDGACEQAGSFRTAPYSAEYVFLRKN